MSQVWSRLYMGPWRGTTAPSSVQGLVLTGLCVFLGEDAGRGGHIPRLGAVEEGQAWSKSCMARHLCMDSQSPTDPSAMVYLQGSLRSGDLWGSSQQDTQLPASLQGTERPYLSVP